MQLAFSIADQEFARGRSLGILNNSLGLLRELARQINPAVITVLANQSLQERGELPVGVTIETHNEALGGGLRRILWDQWGVYRAARSSGRQWLVLPKGFASFTQRCPVKLAVIINDGMTDHYARHHPGYFKKSEHYYFTRALRASMHQARVIFTISEFTANEVRRLARLDGITLPPVRAIGVGFNAPPEIIPAGPVSRRGIIVMTSSFPHKRTASILHMLQHWCETTAFNEPVQLVGSLPQGVTLPQHLPWAFHARPDNAEFRALMSTARALIYSSEYEGFGMPPVEAAFAGVCPVYSDIPTLHEVMQGMGCPFGNHDYDSFAAAMSASLDVPAATIRQWAENLHRRYNWPRVARDVAQTMAALE